MMFALTNEDRAFLPTRRLADLRVYFRRCDPAAPGHSTLSPIALISLE
jgi:hypothetical protein